MNPDVQLIGMPCTMQQQMTVLWTNAYGIRIGVQSNGGIYQVILRDGMNVAKITHIGPSFDMVRDLDIVLRQLSATNLQEEQRVLLYACQSWLQNLIQCCQTKMKTLNSSFSHVSRPVSLGSAEGVRVFLQYEGDFSGHGCQCCKHLQMDQTT
jgi:hypothetical protein